MSKRAVLHTLAYSLTIGWLIENGDSALTIINPDLPNSEHVSWFIPISFGVMNLMTTHHVAFFPYTGPLRSMVFDVTDTWEEQWHKIISIIGPQSTPWDMHQSYETNVYERVKIYLAPVTVQNDLFEDQLAAFHNGCKDTDGVDAPSPEDPDLTGGPLDE